MIWGDYMYETALELLNELSSYGYEAYIVGGFVRDYLLRLDSNDIDVTTNATPKQLIDIFKGDLEPKIDYGSVKLIYHGVRFEITTYRKETNYSDNRHPDSIEYIDSLEEDLQRRDFTINTICIDKDGNIIDLLDARKDLDEGIIKCIGDPKIRFRDDSLRILRAIRFATALDFKLDDNIVSAIDECRGYLKDLSYNRKKEELDKMFTCKNVSKAIKTLLDFGLDKELELDRLKDIKATNSLIGIWAVLNVTDIYPFTSNEKDLIEDINTCLELDNMNIEVLYKYGLYVNSVAGEIKGLDIKKMSDKYEHLVIHSRKDLDITSEDIIKVIGKKPGPYVGEIYQDIERLVLLETLNNNNKDIIQYIKDNYSKK